MHSPPFTALQAGSFAKTARGAVYLRSARSLLKQRGGLSSFTADYTPFFGFPEKGAGGMST